MFKHFLLNALAALCIGLMAGITGGTGAESYNVRDSQLTISLAGPAAASTTVTSAVNNFDSGETTALAVQPGLMEFLLTAPALNATILPNAATMTYQIVAADDAALSVNLTVLLPGAIVQTGAGGVGAALATRRWRMPTVCQRYIGFQITSSVGTTTAVAAIATMESVF